MTNRTPRRWPTHTRDRLTRAAVLGLAAALAAITPGAVLASSDQTTLPPDTAATETTDASQTTAAIATTEAPTTTVVVETTQPAQPVLRMPLTGVPVASALDIPARPAIVVKIDNAPGARPQSGFNSADIVFEEIVNDGLTRFGMVFHSLGSDPVGPIRSARLQDVDLFGQLRRPIFVWSGGNATVNNAIAGSDFISLDGSGPGMFRSDDRRSPHNLYNATSAVWAAIPDDTTPPPALFLYRTDSDQPTGEPSGGVGLNLDQVSVEWRWDAATQLWRRTMNGKVHNEATTGQVTTNNVVVLSTQYAPGISASPDAQTIGTGEAFVFTAGGYIHGRWERVDRLAPFTLTDDNGAPILLSPGRTFVEIPRVGNTLPLPPG